MTYVEFTSLLTTSAALGLLSLMVLARDPSPLKPGSVCMVTRMKPAESPAWVCGLPVSKVENAAIALPGTPVQTALGEMVGVVSNVGSSGGESGRVTIAHGALQSGALKTFSINASDAVLLEDRRVLVTDKPL